MSSSRNFEDVKQLLEMAKLDAKELLPISQALVYDAHFPLAELKLLELDGGVEDEIKVGQSLVIRGEADDRAVLCTHSNSYEIKDTETSNSLLLLKKVEIPGETPGSDYGEKVLNDVQYVEQRSVLISLNSYYELKKVKPNFNRIEKLLETTAYRGAKHEEYFKNDIEAMGELVTIEMLLERIPASLKEIEEFLESFRVVELDGFLRLLDEDFLFRILSNVLNYFDSNTIGLSKESIISLILQSSDENEPRLMFEKIFDWFFIQFNEGDSLLYRMNEREICRFIGVTLLKPKGRFALNEFEKAWAQTVPDCLETDLSQLDGICLVDKEITPPQIWYFSASNLPDSIQDRFAYLFETKKKWSLEEIKPYLVWDNWIGMKLTRGKDNLERLQTITKTILLRRTKDEVRENGGAVGNLPPKTIEDIVIDLNEKERKIYDHLDQFAKIEFRAFLNQRKERELQNAANEFMAGGGRGQRKFRDAEEKTFTHIFTLILRLRQASVLPFLIHSMLEDEGTSDDIVVENEDALKELDDDDIISKKNPAFNGDFESAKLQRVYQDLEEIRTKCIEEDRAMDKVIIVSQWTTLLDVVYYQLKKRGFSITQLTGKTPIGDRMEVMSRFNANKRKPQIMLLSLAAGGVGLNLIGANYLFFLDLHWNPQLEFQAQDRIHRFGQTKPVFIRRYIARDTIEAKILELQKVKVELATGIINAKKAGGALTIADMRMIFGI